jgi:hypothetical protein
VPAGQTSGSFTVTSKSVTASTSVNITGVYGGTSEIAALTVSPTAGTGGWRSDAEPRQRNGGSSSTGTVTLTSAAPSGGAAVTLASNNTAAAVPANVIVAAGESSATFTITTTSVNATVTATISVSYGGVTRSTVLTVPQSRDRQRRQLGDYAVDRGHGCVV